MKRTLRARAPEDTKSAVAPIHIPYEEQARNYETLPHGDVSWARSHSSLRPISRETTENASRTRPVGCRRSKGVGHARYSASDAPLADMLIALARVGNPLSPTSSAPARHANESTALSAPTGALDVLPLSTPAIRAARPRNQSEREQL